jgi:hypothetical protein
MKLGSNMKLEGSWLVSYETKVALVDSANAKLIVKPPFYWSATTTRHISKAAKMLGLDVMYAFYTDGIEAFATKADLISFSEQSVEDFESCIFADRDEAIKQYKKLMNVVQQKVKGAN